MNFIPDAVPRFRTDWTQDADAVMIVFFGRSILIRNGQFPSAEQVKNTVPVPPLRIGTVEGRICYACNLTTPPELENGFSLQDLRSAMDACTPELRIAIARGRELLFWRSLHRFCGNCGARLTESISDISMVCPECGTHYFPQIAPAVIVAVLRGEELLLAHNRSFKNNIYGLIAGFVEAGESLEQAVTRELMEETAIRVKNIRYFDSQTWPYPNSLMVGFFADYESGTPEPDGSEIEKADFFTRDHLPEIPQPGSIARRMIDVWLNRQI